MPKVSILLTCYNHIAYLPAAYDSILAQTFTDYEIIAIDDGSKDGTREWLTLRKDGAAERGNGGPPLALIFNETNLGTYASLNVALAAATGDFIAILNDDDVWAPTKLKKQLELFGNNPQVGLVHTDGSFIDGSGKQFEGAPLGFTFPRFETGDILLGLLYENKIIASAALVRRECFEKLGGFNEKYFGSGDWEMWLRIAEQYEVGFVPEPLTFYRVHGANASHKLERIWKDDQMLREWMASREGVYRSKGYDEFALRAALSHNAACLGTVQTLNGDAAGGRRSYKKSLRLQPMRFKSYLRYIATYLPKPLFRKLT